MKVVVAKNILQSYKWILIEYFKENCKYPTSEQGLYILVENHYVKTILVDPWDNPYLYINNQGIIGITSLGSDGKKGGTGYNSDIHVEWSFQQDSLVCNPIVAK